MEDSSKTPEQSLVFSGTALPSANSKTVSHFGTFPPRNIQSTKANESPSRLGGRHPPHQTDARDSVAKELVVLPFSLVRKTKKQESRWEREEEHCCRPHRAQAQKRVCAPASSHRRPSLPRLQRAFRRSPVSTIRGAIAAQVGYSSRWLLSSHYFHQIYKRSNKNPNYSMCVHASSHVTNPYTNEGGILTAEF